MAPLGNRPPAEFFDARKSPRPFRTPANDNGNVNNFMWVTRPNPHSTGERRPLAVGHFYFFTRPNPNSERAPLPGAVRIGPCDPHEVIDVTIVVRRRSKGSGRFPRIEELGGRPVAERRHLTREE